MTDQTYEVRCIVLSGHQTIAEELATALGISVVAASLVVDTHIERGDQ